MPREPPSHISADSVAICLSTRDRLVLASATSTFPPPAFALQSEKDLLRAR